MVFMIIPGKEIHHNAFFSEREATSLDFGMEFDGDFPGQLTLSANHIPLTLILGPLTSFRNHDHEPLGLH